jgi:hypothetical protein
MYGVYGAEIEPTLPVAPYLTLVRRASKRTGIESRAVSLFGRSGPHISK